MYLIINISSSKTQQILSDISIANSETSFTLLAIYYLLYINNVSVVFHLNSCSTEISLQNKLFVTYVVNKKAKEMFEVQNLPPEMFLNDKF